MVLLILHYFVEFIFHFSRLLYFADKQNITNYTYDHQNVIINMINDLLDLNCGISDLFWFVC